MDKIYTLKIPDLSPLISDLNFEESDYMILYKFDDIKFDKFTMVQFEHWEYGFIFSDHRELKWRKIDGQFYVNYSGQNISLSNNSDPIEAETEEDELYLWGRHSSQMSDFAPNEYIELPIPRILKYPISSRNRVKLSLMLQKKEGKPIGYRIYGLREEI